MLPELEHKQRELRNIKESRKPLNRSEFVEHAAKYDEERAQLIDRRRKEREQNAPPAEKSMVSKFSESVVQEDLATKQERERSFEEKKRLYGKKHNYAKFVKEMHWPKVSSKKRIEIELRKEPPPALS